MCGKSSKKGKIVIFSLLHHLSMFLLPRRRRSFLLKEHSGGNKSKRYYNLHGSDINLISFTIFYLFP
jgi:hypothetical protein